MKRMWIVASLLASVACALLGLTAGINLNPATTVHFVPNWGSVGDWVSGVGALLAVAVALWQVHRQQEREKPRIGLHHNLSVRNGGLALGIVSEGHAPVTILGAHLVYDQASTIDFADRLPNKCAFPTRLDRGEVMHFLDLTKTGAASFGKELIEPRLDAMQAQGKQPVLYAEGINEEYFSQLSTILGSRARIYVRTPNSLEALDMPSELYIYLLREALEDTRKQAREKFEFQKRDLLELATIMKPHLAKTESQTDAN